MTPEQISLVQDSFRKVAPIADHIADLFYDRLFAIAPETRALFVDDLAEQKRKLMQMLGAAVSGLNRLDTLLPAVVQLGERHHSYEVVPEHYDQVGQALLWALEQGLGTHFNGDVREAWAAIYGTLADMMIGAAAGHT
ncbi:MAG: hemin receptor [Rhodobacteraceae bacterium]|nr:hemin receptor [Paracoccaceae bacterium]